MTIDPFNPGGAAGGGEALDADVVAFLSGGYTSAVWPKVGFTVEGTVLRMQKQIQRDMESKEPVYFVPGSDRPVKESMLRPDQLGRFKPAEQLMIVLQGEPTFKTWRTLQYEEVALPEDDGIRAVYMKGLMKDAFIDALRKAQAKPELYGYMEITRTGGIASKNPTFGKRHTHSIVWTPAAQNTRWHARLAAQQAEEAGEFVGTAPAGKSGNPFGG